MSSDDGLSVQQAAERLGLHEKTVRRRIREGTLPALRLERPQGHEWRVYPDGLPAALATESAAAESAAELPPADGALGAVQVGAGESREVSPPERPIALATPAGAVESTELLALLDRLARRVEELSGQVGYWRGRFDAEHERGRLLESAPVAIPRKAAPESEVEQPLRPEGLRWWRRLLGGRRHPE